MSLVDVLTNDNFLAEEILHEYPGVMIPDKQYFVEKSKLGKEYKFLGLDIEMLRDFLKGKKIAYDFWMIKKEDSVQLNLFQVNYCFN